MSDRTVAGPMLAPTLVYHEWADFCEVRDIRGRMLAQIYRDDEKDEWFVEVLEHSTFTAHEWSSIWSKLWSMYATKNAQAKEAE